MKVVHKHILNLIFVFLVAIAAAQTHSENNKAAITKTLNSAYFKSQRTIQVLLPKTYSEDKSYPVIYALDGYELFPITSSYSTFLMDYDVIPDCIIVGINHTNRNYETMPNYGNDVRVPVTKFLEGPAALKNHLLLEIVPMTNKLYATSGFNTLIGHSNTATFVNEMISKKEANFNGFIAITPDLLKKQTDYLHSYLNDSQLRDTYYFVSSGLKDNIDRLDTGKMLDTVFKTTKNQKFKATHRIYNAGHLDLVPKSLNDALQFIFSDFKNYDDFDKRLLEDQFSLSAYLDHKSKLSKDIYGIKYTLKEEDFYYLLSIVLEKKDKNLLEQAFMVGEQNQFFSKEEIHSSKAQYYEEIELYEEALSSWKMQITEGYNENTFYYERPFTLLTTKLKRPEEAITFLEKSLVDYPEGALIFNYLIAQTVVEHNLNKERGINAITYCLNNYRENSKFSKATAQEIAATLSERN